MLITREGLWGSLAHNFQNLNPNMTHTYKPFINVCPVRERTKGKLVQTSKNTDMQSIFLPNIF